MNPGDLPLLLVVDDDPDQLALARLAALRAGGLRVATAESGAEVLVLLEARQSMRLAPPDLVLTDLKMPQMNGVELMQTLRAQPGMRAVPVVFLTSSGYNRDRIVAHLAGADAFLQKPVRFGDLVNIMKLLPSYLRQPSDADRPRESSSVPAQGVNR